jgi:pimeloyl-ACP methyl ester carboxylesterase
MQSSLRLIRLPALITLGVTLLRFIFESAELPGASLLNISFLIPVFVVTFSVRSLRDGRGYGGYIGVLMLYTASARIPALLLTLLGQATGLGGEYFSYRNPVFGLILPNFIVWPVVTLALGTLLWPFIALFSRAKQPGYRSWAIGFSVILILIFIGLPYAISRLYTGGVGGRRAFKSTPADYGAPYEEVTLTTRDQLKLYGWYLPHEAGRGTVIFCHGLFNQRSELLEQAVFMRQNGFRGLLFDFRHHGKSDGESTTFGYYERSDVQAAIEYILKEKKETGPIILWGISMGAANALLAASEQSEIRAVIAESSFYSARETLRSDLTRMFRLPAFPFADLVEWITEQRLDIEIDALDVGKAVAGIHDRPVLLVGGSEDARMPVRNNERLMAAIGGTMKEQFVVRGAGHADAWRMAGEEYKARVLDFLNRYGVAVSDTTKPLTIP